MSGEGKIVDVKDLAARYTTDMIGNIAYGIKVDSLNNPDSAFRKYGKKIFECNVIRNLTFLATFCVPGIIPLIRLKVFGESTTKFLRDAFRQTINLRLESKEKRDDLIDILIDLRNTYGNEEINGFSKCHNM